MDTDPTTQHCRNWFLVVSLQHFVTFNASHIFDRLLRYKTESYYKNGKFFRVSGSGYYSFFTYILAQGTVRDT